MLIGQFGETYPPSLDGVGRVMLAYCETLSQMGRRCLYIAPENSKFPKEEVPCELLLYPGLPLPGQSYRFGLPFFSPAFRRQVRKLSFDVVHVHSPTFVGLAARRLAKRSGAPLIATFHSKYYDDIYKGTSSRFLARAGVRFILRFYRSCDEVWAVNHKSAQVLRDYGFDGEIVIMPNGTNPHRVTAAQREEALSRYSLREGVPTLIFAGQMDYKKNVDSILKACALLRDQGLDFQLIMAGGGPNMKGIKALAAELGLMDRTLFTGFLSERFVMLSLFERADLLVFPSLYDNAPLVVREAAVMGTPSLLIENSCAAEGVTHGDNGFLCEDTPEQIAQGIREALPLCAAAGARARETIPVPWLQILNQALERYERLIEKKKSEKGTRSAL